MLLAILAVVPVFHLLNYSVVVVCLESHVRGWHIRSLIISSFDDLRPCVRIDCLAERAIPFSTAAAASSLLLVSLSSPVYLSCENWCPVVAAAAAAAVAILAACAVRRETCTHSQAARHTG